MTRLNRTIHLNYDIAIGGADAMPDVNLVPPAGEGPLRVLAFIDDDGDTHVYVLTEKHFDALKNGVADADRGGLILPADGDVLRVNGTKLD